MSTVRHSASGQSNTCRGNGTKRQPAACTLRLVYVESLSIHRRIPVGRLMGIWTRRPSNPPPLPKYLAESLPPGWIMFPNNGSGLSQSGHAAAPGRHTTLPVVLSSFHYMPLHLQMSALGSFCRLQQHDGRRTDSLSGNI